MTEQQWQQPLTLQLLRDNLTLNYLLRWALAVAWIGFTLNYTLMDADSVMSQLGWLADIFRILHIPGRPANLFHFFSFAVFGFLLAGAIRGAYLSRLTRWHLLFCLLAIFNFSVIQELLQYLSPTRVPELIDVGTNFIGGFTGLAITLMGTSIMNLMRNNN